MKCLIAVFIFLFSISSFAATSRLFSLLGTNYVTDKNVVYDLTYDGSTCRIESTNPIKAYYVSRATGNPVNGFTGLTKNYFSPRQINTPNPTSLNFRFKAMDELERLTRRPLSVSITTEKRGNRCIARTYFIASGQILVSDLTRVDAEFILNGEHPSSIEWLKLTGSNRVCLLGSCK